jgi:hypothetical protein
MPDINVLEIARDDVVPNFQSCAYNLNSGRPDPRGTDPFGSLPITTERINCVQFTYAVLWKIMDLHFPTYTDCDGNCTDLPVQKQKDYMYVKGKIPGKGTKVERIHNAIVSRHSSVMGPVGAIVEYGMGEEVGISNLQPGDFIQFWRRDKKAKRWGPSGHSVLIAGFPKKIKDGYQYETWGAQGSGICYGKVNLNSTKKAFAARITGSVIGPGGGN